MLKAVNQLSYTSILCEDIECMKAFYRDLFPFPIRGEAETGLGFETGKTQFSLRQRTRGYDGKGTRTELPGVQLAFLVQPDEVQECYDILFAKGVKIMEPVTDQPRGHRTIYFADPEGNQLEIYAEI